VCGALGRYSPALTANQGQRLGRAVVRGLRVEIHDLQAPLEFFTDEDFDEEGFEENWGKERQLREELTKAVEALIRKSAPRNPRWWRRRRSTLAARYKERQRTRGSAGARLLQRSDGRLVPHGDVFTACDVFGV
jgi:hypothetical protein